jgi:hypothetical protein
LYFETSSLSRDIPYGDTFIIINRIHLIEDNSKTTFKLHTTVKFVKSVWGIKGVEKELVFFFFYFFLSHCKNFFTGLIEKTATDEVKQFFLHWVQCAKNRLEHSLKLTAAPKAARNGKKSGKKPSKEKSKQQRQTKQVSNPPTEQLPLFPVVPERASAPQNWRDVPNSYLLFSFAVLFFGLFFVMFQVSSLSGQLAETRAEMEYWEDKVNFLQTFLEVFSANVTGASTSLEEQWKAWKLDNSLLDSQFSKWRGELGNIQQSLQSILQFLDQAQLDRLSKAPHQQNEGSWFTTLLPLATATAVVAAVYKLKLLPNLRQ